MRWFSCTWACLALAAVASGDAGQRDPGWSTVLHSSDFIVGADLQKMSVRHKWAWEFNAGEFEIAVKKTAIPVSAPQCRMDYLILRMPVYYPENPAQATTEERKAVYNALVGIKKTGKGGLKIRFDALWYLRQGPSGPELTTCNIYFSLPLDKDSVKILP